MDDVQKFVSKNQHQFGYVMQVASDQWKKKDPTGALTVGPCNYYIEKHGDYHTLLDKLASKEEITMRALGKSVETMHKIKFFCERAKNYQRIEDKDKDMDIILELLKENV